MARGEIYAQLSVDYYDNARVIDAGEAAELLYVRALCLANRLLSDGVILRAHLVALRLTGSDKRAATLVKVGLWEPVDGGWRIVGWAERNRSRVDVMAIREAAAERKRRERRERYAAASCVTDAPNERVTTADVTDRSRVTTADVTEDGQVTSHRSHAPIEQRSTLNAQRSTNNEQRTTNNEQRTSDEVNFSPSLSLGESERVGDPASQPPTQNEPTLDPLGLRAAYAQGRRSAIGATA